jgi:DNA/RNA-binding domain of Phe-tRNA-synthetase-like protein
MHIDVNWNSEIRERLLQLAICVGLIDEVTIQKENEQLRQLKTTLYEEVRRKYAVGTLKDDLTVKAYRSLYWKLDIDPTKTRPAGEALLRRVLHGEQLPNISTVVDAYNLASMKTIVPMSGFDRDLLTPPFQVRFARDGETFMGIGMETPMLLTQKMLVLTDEKQVLCNYPYRDCNHTKITMTTKNVAIVGYGAPGMVSDQLKEAVETALSFIKQVSGGEMTTTEVFRS